jgi:hypothetical protein
LLKMGFFAAAAAKLITADACQAVLRQYMNPCTNGSPLANDLTPTLKKLILNTREKLAASSQATVIAEFESGWPPNRQSFKGEGPGDVPRQSGRPECGHH